MHSFYENVILSNVRRDKSVVVSNQGQNHESSSVKQEALEC